MRVQGRLKTLDKKIKELENKTHRVGLVWFDGAEPEISESELAELRAQYDDIIFVGWDHGI